MKKRSFCLAMVVMIMLAACSSTPTLEEKISDKDGMVMVYVQEGKFKMGKDDPIAPDQGPMHTVSLDSFWIDKTEVTNQKYEKCVDAGACEPPAKSGSYSRDSYYGDPQYADSPVIYVDWFRAEAYCKWAGRRLPTEAEWEKAARGSDGRTFPWGEEIDCNKTNYSPEEGPCIGDTSESGSYPDGASLYGALDMGGNVWEWTADWYGSEYFSNSPSSNPTGSSSGEKRVLKGGSWDDTSKYISSAYRSSWDPSDDWIYSIGFRCAISDTE
jgi:formylglycine-generating enzyme required for sulfatase activity